MFKRELKLLIWKDDCFGVEGKTKNKTRRVQIPSRNPNPSNYCGSGVGRNLILFAGIAVNGEREKGAKGSSNVGSNCHENRCIWSSAELDLYTEDEELFSPKTITNITFYSATYTS